MTCENCGRELPKQTGRGRPRKRCEACSREKKNAQRRQPTTAQARKAAGVQRSGGDVEQATHDELAELPEHLSRSATAMAALELARSIDLGEHSFRFQAGLVKELRDCMTELKKQAPAREEDALDDLAARRARRRADAANQ